MQLELHPSPFDELLSSHSSESVLWPLPQLIKQEVWSLLGTDAAEDGEPPFDIPFDPIVQVELHPSPALV